jgi:hypothetical protein
MINKFSFSKAKYKHSAKCVYKVYSYNNNFKLMKFIGIYNFNKKMGMDCFYINCSYLKRSAGYGLNFNLRLKYSRLLLFGISIEADNILYNEYLKRLLFKKLLGFNDKN